MIKNQYRPRTHPRRTVLQAAAFPAATCRAHLVDRMAEDMRDMTASGETPSLETLKSRGYPEAVIARLSGQAAAVARRRWHKQVAGSRSASREAAR